MISLGECPQLGKGDIQMLNRWAGFDPELTPSVHRSATKSVVPKGATFGSERFGEPVHNELLDHLVGAQQD
jgi:hypothetical protein